MIPEQVKINESKIQKIFGDDNLHIIDSEEIIMPTFYKTDEDFWQQHRYNKKEYLEFLKEYDSIYDKLDAECSAMMNEMMIRKESRHLYHLFAVMFIKPNALTVYKHKDKIFCGDDGRHRIHAAQELQMYIPVYIKSHPYDLSKTPSFS